MALPDSIPPEMLDEPVSGGGLHTGDRGASTLRDQLDPAGPTLLVFLRHLGCIFCREMVKDIRIAADRADAGQPEKRYPRVVFVHSATAELGARFFGRFWPGASAISDPEKRLYRAAGLGRGTFIQLLGPRAIAAALRGLLKGHTIGSPAGDPWMMPGLLLVSPQGRILHRHVPRHAGDHPRFDTFERLTRDTAPAPRYSAEPLPARGNGYPAPRAPAGGSALR